MTAKQRKFVDEYLVDLNATQAAIRAGYSEKTAQQIGSENLLKPVIQEKIQKAMNKTQERTKVTQDMVINELAAIAFSKVTDIAEVKSNTVRMKNTSELEEDVKKAIVGVKEGKYRCRSNNG